MNRLSYLAILSTVLAFAAACGDDDGGTGDTVDAMPQPDGDTVVEPGPCALVIGYPYRYSANGTSNLAGVPVFFHAPDGQLLGFELTDVKGEAGIDLCVEDTMVSFVLDASEYDSQVVTYTNVQPESTVYYRVYEDYMPDPYTYANVSVTGDADVSLFPDGGTSTRYWTASIGCSSEGGDWRYAPGAEPNDYTGPKGPILFTTNQYGPGGLPFCNLGNNTDDIDVLARLETGKGNDVGYAFIKDVPITQGSDEDNVTENAVTLPAWTRGRTENAVLMTNLPTNTEYSEWGAYQMVDGITWADSGDSDEWVPSEGDVVPPVLADSFRGLPDGFGDYSYGHGHWWLEHFSNISLWTHNQGVESYGMFNATVTVDAGDRLPIIDSIAVADIYTAQPKITWSSDSPINGTVGAFEFILFTPGDTSVPTSAADPREITWLVITPNTGSGEFVVPRLTDEFVQLIEKNVIGATPIGAQIWDASHIEYNDIITNPPFDPWNLSWSYYGGLGDNIPVVNESSPARVRRTRTRNYQYDE